METTYALSRIARARQRLGDIAGADDVRRQAQKVAEGVKEEANRLECLAQIARDQALGGDPEGALRTLDGIPEGKEGFGFQLVDTVLEDISLYYARRSMFTQASRTAQSLFADGRKTRALIAVALCQADAGQRDASAATLELARRAAGSIADAPSRLTMVFQVASAEAKGSLGSRATLSVREALLRDLPAVRGVVWTRPTPAWQRLLHARDPRGRGAILEKCRLHAPFTCTPIRP